MPLSTRDRLCHPHASPDSRCSAFPGDLALPKARVITSHFTRTQRDLYHKNSSFTSFHPQILDKRHHQKQGKKTLLFVDTRQRGTALCRALSVPRRGLILPQKPPHTDTGRSRAQ